MILEEIHARKIPEYYDWMYLDGYTPDEIMFALHRKLDREYRERQEALEQEQEFPEVRITSEVRVK